MVTLLSHRSLVLCLLWMAAVPACRPVGPTNPVTLTDADRAAIQALDTAFIKAWLRDDTAAVLRLFQPDAVLLPPNSTPIIGLDAIKAYWWPTDGSHTRITGFTRHLSEVEGSGVIAYFVGSASLDWVYQRDGKETAQTSRSTDLVVLKPDAAGRWRIARQMWTQLPP